MSANRFKDDLCDYLSGEMDKYTPVQVQDWGLKVLLVGLYQLVDQDEEKFDELLADIVKKVKAAGSTMPKMGSMIN